MSPETIYQALYVQARGGLKREIAGSAAHRPDPPQTPQRPGKRTPGSSDPMVMISERPPEIEDRAVPGHWEGDLITGAYNQSAIATLVERTTRYVMLVHLPGDHTAETVRDGLIKTMATLPEHLRGSLTWDQGAEMAGHKSFSMATDMHVYFCDPASPWQRGSQREHQRAAAPILPQRHRPVRLRTRRPRTRRPGTQRTPTQNARLGYPSRAST